MKKLLLTLLAIPLISMSYTNAQGGGGCQALFQYTLGNCPSVMFFDGSTVSPLDSIVSWAYDFGDGNTATTPNASNTYAANGGYNVCLTIMTMNGCQSMYCDSVFITCLPNASCQAMFQYTLGTCPDIMFFDGSTASPGTIVSWDYDFGDGNTSTSASPTNTYMADGAYNVCLTIMTSDSCTSTFCDSIVISCGAFIDELGINNLIVSPNPGQEMISVQLTEVNAIQYKILGLDGSIQAQGKRLGAKNHSFDISALAKGLYILEVNIDGTSGITRFMKE